MSSGKVVELATARIRTRSKWAARLNEAECKHRNITLDDVGHVLECDDCKRQLSAFWWLRDYLPELNDKIREIGERREDLRKAAEKTLHLRAARALERAWRSRSTVPTCPHCSMPVLPEEKFGTAFRPAAVIRKNRREVQS